MVAIVVVSHSLPMATAAVELALEMAATRPPVVEVAAGVDDGLGTDAAAVAEAIQRADAAAGGAGVLVITDLGSAVMSSEMALELVDGLAGEVRLSRAPFVEGLVAAVVQASIGSALDEVERQAAGALRAKSAQLGGNDDSEATAVPSSHASAADARIHDVQTLDVPIINAEGLHARPAVLLARAAAELPVDVLVTNLETGAGPVAADSMLELMSLGVRQGMQVRLSAEGTGAAAAVQSLAALIASGMGEEAAAAR